MYQHPIPQNVTSYQFRLVGDMTLKQFFELAGGIGVGAFFYFTNLPFIFKWPLIIGSVVFGVGLAFVPLEERPLDQWIIAYIKAIYRPTQFIWRKQPKEPDYLTFKTNQSNPQITIEERNLRLATKQQGLNTFIKTLPHQQTSQQVTDQETNQLENITRLFYAYPATQPQVTTPPSQTNSAPPTSPVSNSTSNSKTVNIPASEQIHLTPDLQPTSHPTAPIKTQPHSTTTHLDHLVAPSTTKAKATTSNTLPFPSTPNTPNTVVGMVLSADNHLLGNAIIEIRLPSGEPVRATKTNKLGQFFSSTPLKNGIYDIYVEKDGYQFDIINLELSGNIVPPIAINAKPSLSNPIV